MSGTESFETSLCELMGYFYDNSYATSLCERIRRAHNREIRDTAQQQYHRGFEAGQHSMDAEHRAIAMRLRELRFDGGSHENLSKIAYAIYPCATGWTCESADGLRDELVRLMGGVSYDTRGAGCCCAAADSDGDCGLQREEVEHGGATHDCADDSRGGSCGELVHMDGLNDDDLLSSITDELRGWAESDVWSCKWEEFKAIADRIDERAKRDRESDQLRIEKLERQRDHWRQQATDLMNHADAMEHERDELQAKLDELEKLDADTSLAAFGDDNSKLRRLLSRAAKLLEIAEHDRDTNYAYWMDCKEKVVHANATIDELQAKLDAIRDSLDG